MISGKQRNCLGSIRPPSDAGVVYVGNLPPDIKEKEVDDLFYKVRCAFGTMRSRTRPSLGRSRSSFWRRQSLPPKYGCTNIGGRSSFYSTGRISSVSHQCSGSRHSGSSGSLQAIHAIPQQRLRCGSHPEAASVVHRSALDQFTSWRLSSSAAVAILSIAQSKGSTSRPPAGMLVVT